jgi:hypothetical protein
MTTYLSDVLFWGSVFTSAGLLLRGLGRLSRGRDDQ